MNARLIFSVIVGSLMAAAGCSPEMKAVGDSGVESKYFMRTLTARLPAEKAQGPAVAAAVDEVLRQRGYGITESSATADSMKTVAHPPRTSNWPRVVIRSHTNEVETVLEITNEPFADEELADSLLRGILDKLSL